MKPIARHRGAATPRAQSGAVLVTALVLLVVLTLLAVTSSRSSLTEERVTSNTQDANVAFQAAEAALRAGEEFLQQPNLPYFEGNDGLYQPAPPTGAPLWSTVDWLSAAATRQYSGLDDAPGSLSQAQASYIVEELPPVAGPGESLAADAPVDETQNYRITARGLGIAGNARATVQSIYRR